MNNFVRLRNPEKLTIVVMDNATVHRKAEKEASWEWLRQRVWAWVLPAYSPVLNPIEILWKKIKYEGLLWDAYHCFDSICSALSDIFENFDREYRINFA